MDKGTKHTASVQRMPRPERVCVDCGVPVQRNRDHCKAHVLFLRRWNLYIEGKGAWNWRNKSAPWRYRL